MINEFEVYLQGGWTNEDPWTVRHHPPLDLHFPDKRRARGELVVVVRDDEGEIE